MISCAPARIRAKPAWLNWTGPKNMLLLIPGPVSRLDPPSAPRWREDIAPWDDDFRPTYAADAGARRGSRAGGVEGVHVSLPLQGCGHMMMEAAIRTFVPARAKLLGPAERRLCRPPGAAGHGSRPGGRGQLGPRQRGRCRPPRWPRPWRPKPGHRPCMAVVRSETGSGIVNDPDVLGPWCAAAGRRLILRFRLRPSAPCRSPGAIIRNATRSIFTADKCLEGMPGLRFRGGAGRCVDGRARQCRVLGDGPGRRL